MLGCGRAAAAIHTSSKLSRWCGHLCGTSWCHCRFRRQVYGRCGGLQKVAYSGMWTLMGPTAAAGSGPAQSFFCSHCALAMCLRRVDKTRLPPTHAVLIGPVARMRLRARQMLGLGWTDRPGLASSLVLVAAASAGPTIAVFPAFEYMQLLWYSALTTV
ncbi:unnamed protein product, partial [Phaeothamnion confervicola]